MFNVQTAMAILLLLKFRWQSNHHFMRGLFTILQWLFKNSYLQGVLTGVSALYIL